ncbi:MAG: SpoIID/LytB domain-containing protein [Candidatus Sericytochromatia bacterium]|nr:SpoIID/LytB domain-containing protein [Candidatus Tanganyikabacteria bacterium]
MRRALVTLFMLAAALHIAPPAAAMNRAVRIGILDGVGSFTFSSASEAAIVSETGVAVGSVRPREAWAARSAGRQLSLSVAGKTLSFSGPVRVIPLIGGAAEVPLVYIGSKWYRGLLEIRPGLVAVNEVPLEQYLYGVVPAEMPSKWPLEALKAQAVAARSYTLAKLGDMASRGYDLKPTTDHQVYGGAAKERPETNYAVDATRGEVLLFNGAPIPAFYCSAAGGYTDSAETVWGGRSIPYLLPVPDFDQEAPSYVWQSQLSAAALRNALGKLGVAIGDVVAIEPRERGYSGRVKTLAVRGTQGVKIVSGERFRWATGLKSSLFNVAPVEDGGRIVAFAFAGRGHGHGLGLSQWGARGMGTMGYNYAQILAHYYPGVQLAQASAQTAAYR